MNIIGKIVKWALNLLLYFAYRLWHNKAYVGIAILGISVAVFMGYVGAQYYNDYLLWRTYD